MAEVEERLWGEEHAGFSELNELQDGYFNILLKARVVYTDMYCGKDDLAFVFFLCEALCRVWSWI